MTLTVEFEPVQQLLDDGLSPLLDQHWEEVALNKDSVPLDPDWKATKFLEDNGYLKTIALRRHGRLIGYNAFIVAPHLHYRTLLQAVNDIIYVDPDERGAAGVKLIRRTEALLGPLGVKRIVYHTKLDVLVGHKKSATVGDLLERMGYRHAENIHDKLLE